MIYLHLLRHGPTPWNAQGRIQGHADIGLDQTAERQLRQQKLSDGWLNLPWFTSPLLRCRQTASLLGAKDPIIVESLREMHWGEFEGLTLDKVNREIRQCNIQPDRGIDLRPPGGESPRMVRDRFHQWLLEIPEDTGSLMAVTHKGIIRAAISHATGWDMMSQFPRSLDWKLPHRFELDTGGVLRLDQINYRWKNSPH